MRVLLQRVSSANVVIDNAVVGEIGKGLLILLGITHDDTEKDIAWIVKKVLQLRIFRDEQDKMNLSVQDVGGDLLIVSQFTLYADTVKGNRPSYMKSAPPSIAIPLYEQTLQAFRTAFAGKVETGVFGADMKVTLVNDGPVTIMIDSQAGDK